MTAVHRTVNALRCRVLVPQIIQLVSEECGITARELTGRSLAPHIAGPRQIAWWLARQLTPLSYPAIGRQIGKRHHTTVMHGVYKVDLLVRRDQASRETLEALRRRLTGPKTDSAIHVLPPETP